MKALDNWIIGRAPRRSLVALTESQTLRVDLINRESCLRWRAAVDLLQANKQGEDYAAWLEGKRLQDNLTNRIDYTAWLYDTGQFDDSGG